MGKIKIALAGVGNCASALVQGIEYYKHNGNANLGLIHHTFAGYFPADIEVVAAFDVSAEKVGRDVSEAIFAKPNNTMKIREMKKLGVNVLKGELKDGIGEYLKDLITISEEEPVDVADFLIKSEAEILVNMVPSGAIAATKYYAEQALKAKCAFLNATPHEIASDLNWAKKFKHTGVPIAGDDIMNQIGSTIIHKSLL
ncbi:MAG: inositol-3-phosphate synthase, partial [Promethearchaeota archaeon]